MIKSILTLGRQPKISAEEQEAALRQSIADKMAIYTPEPEDERPVSVEGILIVEGEPSDIEMCLNQHVTDRIVDEWAHIHTFVEFVQEACTRPMLVAGELVELTPEMMNELVFLQQMAVTQLAHPKVMEARKKKAMWSNVPDAKSFNKQDI